MESLGGVTDILHLLTMRLSFTLAFETNTLGMSSAFTNNLCNKVADVIEVTTRRIGLESGINRLVGDAQSEHDLANMSLDGERVQIAAIF